VENITNIFVANFWLILTVKKFENWLAFVEVMKKCRVLCFLTHNVVN